jgi:hypothetical protein
VSITQERLRELFDYHEDGFLVWRVKRRGTKGIGSTAGAIRSDGYRQMMVDYQKGLMHRFIWVWHYGLPAPITIDHINQDRGDSRIENLREVTKSENGFNSDRVRSRTGFKGVKVYGVKFVAQIMRNYKQIYLGIYNSPEEAHAAYLIAKENYIARAT